MRNKLRNSYRGRVIFNTAASGIITGLVEVFLITNINLLDQFLDYLGYTEGIFLVIEENTLAFVLLYVLIGIFTYTFCFSLLQHRHIKYMQRIATVMRDISAGDFDQTVEVTGDDELSDMAFELNQMSEQIKNLIEREREAEQTKNDLITNVAHDLRTPLTSIIGYLELLSSDRKLDDETRKKYVRVAYDKAYRLQQLIEDLFGFTKLNYGHITAEMEELDIVKLLEQLLDEFYPQFTRNDLSYEYHPDVPTKMIYGDGVLLARLFENLLNNAVKYGKDGKLITVNLTTEEELVRVQIINYGAVIPEADLEHVFDKFYRVEQSRSGNTGGTGLGLAIAKNVAQLHGGLIKASSSLSGTIFEVVIRIDGGGGVQ